MARRNNQNPNNGPTLFDLPGIDDFTINFVKTNRIETEPADTGLSLDLNPDASNPAEPILLLSFGSGSSGNATYIGTRKEGFLIDAGVDATTIIEGLRNNGLSIDRVKGICLTHDHSDHVRYAYTLVRKHQHIGIYCTPKTLSGMLRRHSLSRRIKDYHRPIYKEFPFSLAGFELTAFDLSHDATDNCGFFITRADHRIAVATDLGCITPRVDYYMAQANCVVIESNYDATMLDNGPYPIYLKARIASERGHLENTATASFLKRIYTPYLRYIFLCHLSQDNNTPEIAIEASRQALLQAGAPAVGDGSGSLQSRDIPLQLTAFPRYDISPLFTLRLD